MARRRYPQRFQCAYPGCGESASFESETAKEAEDTWRTYSGKWKCLRHYDLDALITPDRRKKVFEIASTEASHGRYWGQHGFLSGPGFKVFSKDFPTGTVLRVTAEVILPSREAATPAMKVGTPAQAESPGDEVQKGKP